MNPFFSSRQIFYHISRQKKDDSRRVFSHVVRPVYLLSVRCPPKAKSVKDGQTLNAQIAASQWHQYHCWGEGAPLLNEQR